MFPARSLTAIAMLASLSACGGKKDHGPPPVPTVGIVAAQPGSVAMATELPGRTDAFLVSDVRPQVNGIVLRRLFVEGSLVRQGQQLYQIDPALYRAAVAQARGQLASAQANAVAARLKAGRYTDLEKINAVARQDAADARAAAGQADALVVQEQAALETAQINLRYTRVDAPISGRISRSSVTPGALVTSGQTTALATITALDPIYVDIQQSASDLVALRQAFAAGGALPDRAPVRLKLDDGGDYPLAGTLEFSEVQVDASTGAVTLRARFPNPRGLLLPGMFVRAVVTQARRRDVFLLPGAAVTHDPKGQASVLIVGGDGKVALRDVQTSGMHDNRWVVTGGLKPGDRVIVQGSGKAQPGQSARAVPASADPAVVDAGAKNKKDGKSGAPGAGQ